MGESFSVSHKARCVQGHFPEAPVVPGAYLLAQLHTDFNRSYPEGASLRWKKVKFIAPVVPDEQVDVRWDTSAWPQLKVTLSVAGERKLQASAEVQAVRV